MVDGVVSWNRRRTERRNEPRGSSPRWSIRITNGVGHDPNRARSTWGAGTPGREPRPWWTSSRARTDVSVQLEVTADGGWRITFPNLSATVPTIGGADSRGPARASRGPCTGRGAGDPAPARRSRACGGRCCSTRGSQHAVGSTRSSKR
jgi:hypothetical protein